MRRSNPVSNPEQIYKKLGYDPILDFVRLSVVPLLHQLQIGVVDHLGPFVGFGGKEFAEF
jgi:hypothetical protein